MAFAIGEGDMAEPGEAGTGRMAEPIEIASAAERLLGPRRDRGGTPLMNGVRLLVKDSTSPFPSGPGA